MNSKSNKELVLDFYRKVVGQRNSDLIDHYVSDDYKQHSPSIKDGKAGLRDAIEMLKQLPKADVVKSPIVLALAEDDYVMLLLDLEFMGKRLYVADLFRVINGMIVEHWDAMQDITSTEVSMPFFDVTFNAVLRDDDKATIKKLLELRPCKVLRIVTEGAVIGVQSEIQREGNSYASYDFLKIVDSKIVQSWRVEQAVLSSVYHNNGMF